MPQIGSRPFWRLRFWSPRGGTRDYFAGLFSHERRTPRMNGSGSVFSSMKHLSKVVWFEGMYLAPHHFQAQTQSFEDLIQFSTTNLWFEPYDFVRLELDAAALPNANVPFAHARVIFSSCLALHQPNSDPPSPSRYIADLFPPT